jgi:single-strand DNA-binding protein
MSNGDPVTSLSLGVTKSWKDKSGAKQEKTEWVRVVVYSKLSELASQYVKKGDPIYISGEMATRKYTDKSNVERYITEIVADKMQFLGGKQGASNSASKPEKQSKPNESGWDDFEDSIPF